jgi:hypothetical protein
MELCGAPNLALIDTVRLRTAWGPAGRSEPRFLDEKNLFPNLGGAAFARRASPLADDGPRIEMFGIAKWIELACSTGTGIIDHSRF